VGVLIGFVMCVCVCVCVLDSLRLAIFSLYIVIRVINRYNRIARW